MEKMKRATLALVACSLLLSESAFALEIVPSDPLIRPLSYTAPTVEEKNPLGTFSTSTSKHEVIKSDFTSTITADTYNNELADTLANKSTQGVYSYNVNRSTTVDVANMMPPLVEGDITFTTPNHILGNVHLSYLENNADFYIHADEDGLALLARHTLHRAYFFDTHTTSDVGFFQYSKTSNRFQVSGSVDPTTNSLLAGVVFNYQYAYTFGIYSIGALMKVDSDGYLIFSHYIRYRDPETNIIQLIYDSNEKLKINNKTGEIEVVHGKGYIETPIRIWKYKVSENTSHTAYTNIRVSNNLIVSNGNNMVCLDMTSNIINGLVPKSTASSVTSRYTPETYYSDERGYYSLQDSHAGITYMKDACFSVVIK